MQTKGRENERVEREKDFHFCEVNEYVQDSMTDDEKAIVDCLFQNVKTE